MICQFLCLALVHLFPQASIVKDSEAALRDLAQSPTFDRLRILEEKERQEAARKEAQWWLFPSSGSDWCKYLWPAWSLNPKMNGRETYRKCGLHEKMEKILVNCDSLKISTQGGLFFISKEDYGRIRYNEMWSAPRFPGDSGEREMVAALCDNIIHEGNR